MDIYENPRATPTMKVIIYLPRLRRHGLLARLLLFQLLVLCGFGVFLDSVDLEPGHHLGEDVGLDGEEDDVALQDHVGVVVRRGRAQLAPVHQVGVGGGRGQNLKKERKKENPFKISCQSLPSDRYFLFFFIKPVSRLRK